MSDPDIRWIQRFNHFSKALSKLGEAVALAEQRPISELEGLGFMHVFEFTHELAWNTLKDFLERRGVQKMYGSRDATREAFKAGLIVNGDAWMDMIKSRNMTSHTYDEDTAAQIVSSIRSVYFTEFNALRAKLEELKKEEEA